MNYGYGANRIDLLAAMRSSKHCCESKSLGQEKTAQICREVASFDIRHQFDAVFSTLFVLLRFP